MLAAQTYLRAQGAGRIALIGAGLGGTASLVVAAQQPPGLEAVITLSAAVSIDGLAAGPDVMQTVTAAKLFLAGTTTPSERTRPRRSTIRPCRPRTSSCSPRPTRARIC